MHKRTTFFQIEVMGPFIPLATVATNPQSWALAERTQIRRHDARHGRWSIDSLQRMATRAGVQLVAAYWMDYCPRDGYHNKRIIL